MPLGGIFAALLAADLVRKRSPAVDERFRALFRGILDPKDHVGLNGSTLYFGGCALTVALFDPDPACVGLFALTLGDPAAAIVGGAVRSPRRGRVSVAGSGACLVVSAAAAYLLVGPVHALVAGVVSAAVEALSGSKLDNLSIPVAVALALQFL